MRRTLPGTFITFDRPLPIVADTLALAVTATETYLGQRYGNVTSPKHYLSRYAEWRKKPISEAQGNFLTKLGIRKWIKVPKSLRMENDAAQKTALKQQVDDRVSSMTRGDAERMITQLQLQRK
jgi:hypothetical protein